MIGSVNYFEFTQGKKKLVFLDSFNFFKHSLKEIAKELNYKKYADDEEYNLSPEAWNKYIEKMVWNYANQTVKFFMTKCR